MSILSDEERQALQAIPLDRARVRRAEALVNPASGLANDYLNLFNEIVMLIEQLPGMPELIDDIQRWRPMPYRDYFERSVLPGRRSAIDAYDRLDGRFRREFESIVAELDARATGAVAAIRRHVRMRGDDATGLAAACERAGNNIRATLDRATALVNHGAAQDEDAVQARTDALFARAAAI